VNNADESAIAVAEQLSCSIMYRVPYRHSLLSVSHTAYSLLWLPRLWNHDKERCCQIQLPLNGVSCTT